MLGMVSRFDSGAEHSSGITIYTINPIKSLTYNVKNEREEKET